MFEGEDSPGFCIYSPGEIECFTDSELCEFDAICRDIIEAEEYEDRGRWAKAWINRLRAKAILAERAAEECANEQMSFLEG